MGCPLYKQHGPEDDIEIKNIGINGWKRLFIDAIKQGGCNE